MKLIASDDMRMLDQRTIHEAGIPGEQLMEAAGEGLAESIRRLAKDHALVDCPVLMLAGGGNNGGDVFVAARSLFLHDEWPVEVWLTVPENSLKGDALQWFRKMKKAGVPYQCFALEEEWRTARACGTDAEILVDGLLGTGASGKPRGVIAEAIDFLKEQADHSLIVAVDVPSAMEVAADLTVTMGLPKIEMLEGDALDQVGALDVVDIGIPEAFLNDVAGSDEVELLHTDDLTPLFRRRSRSAHKGVFGHVLCVGGSPGYSGAIAMAAEAALRSGAGLVSCWVPESICGRIAAGLPELMVHHEKPDTAFRSILMGPGMGRTEKTKAMVLDHLASSELPVVLDADALSVLAGHTGAIADAACPVVITPHPGEFATLFGLKPEEVQSDRLGMARMAAAHLKCVVVLKGAGTIIAAPDGPAALNLTGNPGMATAGSGDLLAGLLVGLLGQGLPLFSAACAAVWLHGRSGDLAAAMDSQMSVIARDFFEQLPHAIREVSCR